MNANDRIAALETALQAALIRIAALEAGQGGQTKPGAEGLLEAVHRVAADRRDGLAPLWILRAQLSCTRKEFDAEVHRLGVARLIDLTGTDNQHLLTAEQADALISNPHGAPTAYLSIPGADEEFDEI